MKSHLFKVLSILYDRTNTKEQRNEELRRYETNRAIDEKVIDVIEATGGDSDEEKVYYYLVENSPK